MKRRVAELLIICILAGTVAWGAAARENSAKASTPAVIGAFASGIVTVKTASAITDTWTETGYWNMSQMANDTVNCSATVGKGTVCGKISITGQICRGSGKVPFSCANRTYQVYCDGLNYSVTVIPADVITLTVKKDRASMSANTVNVYPASELLTVDMSAQWAFGTQMTSGMMSSYPNQPEGGIHIYDYSPKKNVQGSSSFNVFLSYPCSIGKSFDFKWDYLQILDRTPYIGGRKYGVSFDYKKWAGASHSCDTGRQKVIFGKSTLEGGFSWYTTDSKYKMSPAIVYSMTLCRESKSTITEMKNGKVSFTYIHSCEWK